MLTLYSEFSGGRLFALAVGQLARDVARVVFVDAFHQQLNLIVIFDDTILATRTQFNAILIPVRSPTNNILRAPAFDFYAARQVCRKAVMNGVVIFYQTPILLHRTAAAHQMYTTGSTYSILDLPIWHSPQPSANFYRRSKSAKIWPRF